jgi:hypothetical protein
MIKRGEKRPSPSSNDPILARLGGILIHYLDRKVKHNGVLFEDILRSLGEKYNNNWFSIADNRDPKGKMEKLIEMIKSGEPRPRPYDENPEIAKIGANLTSFISLKKLYNGELFEDVLIRLGEQYSNNWIYKHGVIASKMETLIDMIKRGEPKPKRTDKNPEIASLGKALSHYYTMDYKGEPFVNTIRKLGEKYKNNWLLVSDNIDDKGKKKKLIDMIINHEEKPHWSQIMYTALIRYTVPSSNSYDRNFTKQAQQLCIKHGNYWFEKSNAIWDKLKYYLSMRIKDKDKINKNDVIRLNRCLLNPDDPYYDYAWNSEWGALAKQLMSEQGIPVKIY